MENYFVPRGPRPSPSELFELLQLAFTQLPVGWVIRMFLALPVFSGWVEAFPIARPMS